MKKILLAVAGIITLSAAQVNAQATFTTQSGSADTVSVPYTGSSDVAVTNYLKSVSNANLHLRWRLINSDIPTGWTFNGFCDNIICRTASPVLAGTAFFTDAIPTSEFADFHALFNGSGAANGTSAFVTMKVDDTTAPGYSRTLTFVSYKAATSVAGINTLQDGIALWPVPAHDAVNISFDPNAGIKLVSIYNLIGKSVSVFRVQGSSARLDVSNLPSGVYMLRLLDGQGSVIATRRFTHQ